MKIHPVGAELFCADKQTETHRRTDLTDLIVAIRNFANVPKFIPVSTLLMNQIHTTETVT
jgi:hypothetical protein